MTRRIMFSSLQKPAKRITGRSTEYLFSIDIMNAVCTRLRIYLMTRSLVLAAALGFSLVSGFVAPSAYAGDEAGASASEFGSSRLDSGASERILIAQALPGTPTQAKPVTTPSGLRYTDIKVGHGAAPRLGQTVKVHYTGWLTNGQKFDSSVDRGEPFGFA